MSRFRRLAEQISGSASLLYIADTVFHPLHLEHPDWTSIYDVAPKQAAASKRHILDLAVRSQALVMGHHLLPFPSLGHVASSEDGWQWRPFEPATGSQHHVPLTPAITIRQRSSGIL